MPFALGFGLWLWLGPRLLLVGLLLALAPVSFCVQLPAPLCIILRLAQVVQENLPPARLHQSGEGLVRRVRGDVVGEGVERRGQLQAGLRS